MIPIVSPNDDNVKERRYDEIEDVEESAVDLFSKEPLKSMGDIRGQLVYVTGTCHVFILYFHYYLGNTGYDKTSNFLQMMEIILNEG